MRSKLPAWGGNPEDWLELSDGRIGLAPQGGAKCSLRFGMALSRPFSSVDCVTHQPLPGARAVAEAEAAARALPGRRRNRPRARTSPAPRPRSLPRRRKARRTPNRAFSRVNSDPSLGQPLIAESYAWRADSCRGARVCGHGPGYPEALQSIGGFSRQNGGKGQRPTPPKWRIRSATFSSFPSATYIDWSFARNCHRLNTPSHTIHGLKRGPAILATLKRRSPQ
jgi:hypothetical protein